MLRRSSPPLREERDRFGLNARICGASRLRKEALFDHEFLPFAGQPLAAAAAFGGSDVFRKALDNI
jgi:hypothetical protein